MKYPFAGALGAFLLTLPMAASAQADTRTPVSLVTLAIDAGALGRRVMFELGVSLQVNDSILDADRRVIASSLRRVGHALRSSVDAYVGAYPVEFRSDMIEADDREPEHWNSYGYALYADTRYKESVAAFERAIQLGVNRPESAALNVARAYACAGNDKQAIRWVERALDLGASRRIIDEDPVFDRLRDDRRFRELVVLSRPAAGRLTRGEATLTARVAWRD